MALELRCTVETLVLRPPKFNKKNNTQGGNKHREAMHFKFDLTFRILQHLFSRTRISYC